MFVLVMKNLDNLSHADISSAILDRIFDGFELFSAAKPLKNPSKRLARVE